MEGTVWRNILASAPALPGLQRKTSRIRYMVGPPVGAALHLSVSGTFLDRQGGIAGKARIGVGQAAAHEDAAAGGEDPQVLAALAEAGRHRPAGEEAPVLRRSGSSGIVRHAYSVWCWASAS